ncbi:MAG: LacI family transcriptional regulator [Anaerolineae bacterium]|nr:LacI family transcriptional regulator [Anaerolineae bacterium]
MNRPIRRVTIKQVAEEAGVSTQTVSRVINERPDVAPETRQRVKEVIARLGYQPSSVARSLIQGRTRTLGVVGYGVEYFGPSRNLSGIEQQASEMGYALILDLVRRPEQSNVEHILREMLARHVDGIIWAVPEIGGNREWVTQAPQLPVPLIFLSTQPRPGIAIANVDNRSGGRMATRHLIEQGRRNIGIITGPLSWWEARQRQCGWQDALENAGLPVSEEFVVEGDWSAASGEQGLRMLLERCSRLDAVFASNDQMALGALQAARRAGLRVPEDLAIVGFDDIPEAAYFCPPLTTIRQDMVELGRLAVRELSRMIEASLEGQTTIEPRAILLRPQLIVRESTVPQGNRTYLFRR